MAIDDKIEEIGLKDTAGKSRIDLITPEAILGLGEVLAYGATKYKPNSWQNVDDGINKHYAALMRHAVAWHSGERIDTESGYSHMKHVMSNAMFLLYHESRDKEITQNNFGNTLISKNSPEVDNQLYESRVQKEHKISADDYMD